jgi:hypothetical protein
MARVMEARRVCWCLALGPIKLLVRIALANRSTKRTAIGDRSRVWRPSSLLTARDMAACKIQRMGPADATPGRLRGSRRSGPRPRPTEARRHISIKKALGKLTAPDDLEHQVQAGGFLPLPLSIAHGVAAGQLVRQNEDPFDRMLTAQARAGGLTIVTRDKRFADYDVALMPAWPPGQPRGRRASAAPEVRAACSSGWDARRPPPSGSAPRRDGCSPAARCRQAAVSSAAR